MLVGVQTLLVLAVLAIYEFGAARRGSAVA